MLNKLPITFLSLALCGACAASAADKPAPAAAEATGETASREAAETGTAIGTLGANPATRQISAIVFKAVRSSLANVLPIVDAAVHASPQAAVPEIVTAAVAAVPNPWKQVTYRRLTAPDRKKSATADGRLTDLSGRAPDFKSGPGGRDARGPSEADGRTMTLAEAIARTAFDARPGLSLPNLQAAVDAALLTDPETLIRRIQSPRSVSGVGDAGGSNYANEPLRTPKQSVVNR